MSEWLPQTFREEGVQVALNVPGNFIVGGEGGIALFAGVSRLFSTPAFLLTVALGRYRLFR
jgi:hypothetical protein